MRDARHDCIDDKDSILRAVSLSAQQYAGKAVQAVFTKAPMLPAPRPP